MAIHLACGILLLSTTAPIVIWIEIRQNNPQMLSAFFKETLMTINPHKETNYD